MSTDFKPEQLQLFIQLTSSIAILPSFNDQQLYLLSGEIHYFKANQQIYVPLWLALLFKKQQKCKIRPPHWLKQDILQNFYNTQSTIPELIYLQSQEFFQISYLLLNNCPDDLENPTKIRNLIDSIRDVREKNILKLLKNQGGFLINNKFQSNDHERVQSAKQDKELKLKQRFKKVNIL